MKFDFYLSEMSVSDQHGGGLTLQRILGNDLADIAHFIHVNRFATDLPPTGDFLARSTNLLSIWESDLARKLVGHSQAAKMHKQLLMIKLHAARAAKKINRIFKDQQQITALICPQGANAIFTLEALKKKRNVKYITWIMDDHLVSYDGKDWQYPTGMERVFAKHLLDAAHIFVISPALQEFYKQRFGVESTVLFGSSQPTGTAAIAEVVPNDFLKIGYFGAVAAWQIDALKAVAGALAGTTAQLDIYSGVAKLPAELAKDNIHLKESLAPQLVPDQIRKYDAVLLPISFQQKMRNMSQFNIATKMSEYLACGVPIIAIGPPYAAMIQYLAGNEAAIIVAADHPDEIKDAFKLLKNPQLIAGVLQNAQKLVKQHVGSQPMRAVWEEVVNTLPEFN